MILACQSQWAIVTKNNPWLCGPRTWETPFIEDTLRTYVEDKTR